MKPLPPYAELLGLRFDDAAPDGTPTLLLDYGDRVIGRPGFLHGGAIAGLLEMACYAALYAALGQENEVRVKPINIHVDFIRGGRPLLTRAAGLVSRMSKRVAGVEAIAWQDDRDRPIASARMNMLLLRD